MNLFWDDDQYALMVPLSELKLMVLACGDHHQGVALSTEEYTWQVAQHSEWVEDDRCPTCLSDDPLYFDNERGCNGSYDFDSWHAR